MSRTAEAVEALSTSDADLAEILEYLRSAFPTYEEALGAMGDRDTGGPRSADSSQLRVKIEPVTTALVK
jgi:hypothetical protein